MPERAFTRSRNDAYEYCITPSSILPKRMETMSSA